MLWTFYVCFTYPLSWVWYNVTNCTFPSGPFFFLSFFAGVESLLFGAVRTRHYKFPPTFHIYLFGFQVHAQGITTPTTGILRSTFWLSNLCISTTCRCSNYHGNTITSGIFYGLNCFGHVMCALQSCSTKILQNFWLTPNWFSKVSHHVLPLLYFGFFLSWHMQHFARHVYLFFVLYQMTFEKLTKREI